MARVTEFYLEMELITTQLHMTIDDWLAKPKKVRMLHMMWYRFYLARQAFYNLPEDEQFGFFNRD